MNRRASFLVAAAATLVIAVGATSHDAVACRLPRVPRDAPVRGRAARVRAHLDDQHVAERGASGRSEASHSSIRAEIRRNGLSDSMQRATRSVRKVLGFGADDDSDTRSPRA